MRMCVNKSPSDINDDASGGETSWWQNGIFVVAPLCFIADILLFMMAKRRKMARQHVRSVSYDT